MNTLFDKDASVNAILYILSAFGGQADMHKVYKTLYFADQEHLSKYGRSITGDTYIAMQYGPVPSMIYDITKAVKGDSYFSQSDNATELKELFHFANRFIICAAADYDPDSLSDSDKECLDNAIAKCCDKSFTELTEMSHGLAYNNTRPDREISVKDILCEAGDTEEYANYISQKLKYEEVLCGY